MKKITILAAALLGSVYFANAQVGIGTPTPSASAMLDITATNKGVLIPRVALTDASTPLAGAATHENSLLVYNTATASEGVEGKEVKPGFYYWFNGSWERVTSQTDLENIIGETNQELENIINLLQTAYPSNNLDDSTTTGADLGGGMVYTPASGSTAAKIEYVYFNGTTYVKQDMTSLLNDLIEIQEGNVIYNPTTQVFQYWDGDSYEDISLEDIVQGFETKTSVVTIEGQQFYLAENFEGTIPATIPNPLPTGMYLIDVVGGVVNNFEEILNSNVVIEGEQYTIEEYIEYISQNAMQEGVTKIVITDGQASFQTWNNTTNEWVTVDNAVFSNIVKLNQSLTDIEKVVANNVINYVYTAEPALDGTARTFTIDLTQDLIEQITNNQNVQNAITNLTLGNGSVFYNGTGSAILVGGVSIPADTFYLINENGEGDAIDLGNIVVNEVVENFNTIVNSPVTVNGDTYPTVEEYIQHIAETSDANVGFTTTEITAANNPGGTLIPANSFYYINDAGVKVIIDLEDLVLANESKTGFVTGTNTDGNTFIYYIGEEYLADNDFPTTTIANGWANSTDAPPAGVALLDIPQAVSTNFETILDQTTTILIPGTTEEYYTVEEYIQYISERNGANVGYTTSEITAANNPGGEAIPENSFYYINDAGVKVIIPLGDIVYQGITQFTDNQVVEVKNILGDEIVVDTSVITGDTYKGSVVRRGVYTTTITANTANTTGVTLDVDASEIISITVKYNGGLVANVTDLTVSGTAVGFNIGTGNMYQVLGNTDIVAEVIIDFTTN